jgi:lipid-binding SYLF domain-containing protein
MSPLIKKGLAALFIFSFTVSSLAFAANSDQERVILESKQVLSDIMNGPDQNIPQELLSKCKAIAIYPSVIKGGFIIGARYGRGVVLKREKKTGKWGPVSFSTITGLSGGLQVGIQATDFVLVILNNKGLESLLTSQLTLGGDVSLSIGPIGRTTEIGTDLWLRTGMVSYSRSRGVFGGVALDGAVVTPDNEANKAYYGRPVTSRDILFDNNVPANPFSKELTDLLDDYSTRWTSRKHFIKT